MAEQSIIRCNRSISSLWGWIGALLVVLGLGGTARAEDWSQQLDLKPLRTLAVQNDQTIKTLDSLARQTLVTITGHSTIDGHEAVFTLLDMSFNPDAYVQRNLIKVASLPLRQDFQDLQTLDDAEQERILKEGTVSLAFLEKPEVQTFLQGLQSRSVIRFNAVQQLETAQTVMQQICEQSSSLIPAAMVPPAPGMGGDGMWHPLVDVAGSVPDVVAMFKAKGAAAPPSSPGYEGSAQTLSAVFEAHADLVQGWDARDASRVNQASQNLAAALEAVNPLVYPPEIKRTVEVLYNKFARLTLPGAAFYFTAFVLFLLAARTASPRLRLWGLRFMTVGFLVHTLSIAVRWWLVGSVFPPIKNEFESVMFSAWFGVLVGFVLELRRSQGIFAAAACFVGTLSLVAIFSVPYLTGIEIGGEIQPVQGILMSYWLYIHVTMVTAAYALIGMGFLLGAWWLVLYYRHHGTLRRVPRNLLSSDAAPKIADPEEAFGGAGGGGAMALGFTHTLARMFFFPASVRSEAGSRTAAKALELPSREKDASFLATLDRCNLVMVQLVFLILGVGIMLGAIWADQSWGRPWGWDPKETFALVTWIFYLLVLHVRLVTVDKAWWTAVLACAGFGVMLFNWIGVNFWLVGLHSYA